MGGLTKILWGCFMVKKALTPSQKKAVKTPGAAAVLVEALNETIAYQKQTIKSLEINLRNVQDKYENFRAKFHNSDKRNGILEAQQQLFIWVEIFKYIASVLGASYGINLISAHEPAGWLIIGASTLVYLAITVWQNSINKKEKADRASDRE